MFAASEAAPLTAAVGVAGYICASSTITSAGRSLYHCGAMSPVGRMMSVAVPVGEGTAVLSTERTENLVGSMVVGSMARTMSSATAWTLEAVAVTAVATRARENVVVGFMAAV